LLLAAVLIVLGCKGADKLASHWTSTPIAVDGDATDWDSIPIVYFEEEQTTVGLCNDSANLYLLMRFRDPLMVRVIRMTGLHLYVDNQGGTNERFSLTFRGGPDPERMRAFDSLAPGLRNEQFQEHMDELREKRGAEFVCEIKDHLYEKPIPVDGSEGPAAASAISQGLFVYEFRVPLRKSDIRYYGIDASPGLKIGLGARWGDMGDLPGRPEGGGFTGGMGGGMQPPDGGIGGGPPGGGGMGGGPAGGRRRDRPEMPEKQELWIKTTLAVGPSNDATGTER
jgi:hypothetical protein